MSTNEYKPGLPLQMPRRPSWFASFAKPLIIHLFEKIENGRLSVFEDGNKITFGKSEDCSVDATIIVKHRRFWVDLLFGGSIGACEAYMCKRWDSPDLTAVFRLFLQNRAIFMGIDSGKFFNLLRKGYRIFHQRHKNTLSGSKSNIAAHYDLGNHFYQTFLDTTMTYSAAVFQDIDTSLEEAQNHKYGRLCQKLALKPEHHLVEIGSGWGGMAEFAAKNYGCRVTTTTISQQQYKFARERIAKAGLNDRVEILLEDYRNLQGKFDRLVSIEMIEAVGYEFLPVYLKKCSALLKPDGLMAIQAITILDQEYERHVDEVDFIKRYIFPGSCLTSITSLSTLITANTDLQIVNLEDITSHYVTTLRHWLNNFRKNMAEVKKLGFDSAFCRIWELYLQYCEAGFAEHYIGDIQLLCRKPLALETGLIF